MPPMGQRVLEAVACMVLGFYLIDRRWSRKNEKWAISGVFVITFGMLLVWITGFPWSWTWWI